MLDDLLHVDCGVPIGLLRNGALATVGVAKIDLRNLNGEQAGHLNVTGQAGSGTKSSFLTVVVRIIVDFARVWYNGDASRPPMSARPIIFNVKGRDLMYIDFPNTGLTAGRATVWDQMGVPAHPFEQAMFFAPSVEANRAQTQIIRPVPDGPRQTRPYYWTLADVVRFGLWTYLFSDATQANESMMALADHVLDLISEPCHVSHDHPAGLRLREHGAQSFAELRTMLQAALTDSHHAVRGGGVHAFGTLRALLSRLSLVFGREGRQIFGPDAGFGQPLRVLGQGTIDPIVIDIAGLPPELRRFVVAAVLDQVRGQQMSEHRIPGQVYYLVLDELGLYAPRGARDPITRLVEHIAAQMRSQGIILLGAQQQASRVSETVFGNSAFKVLGATSPVEVESSAWSGLLTPAQKAQAVMLGPEAKMVLVDRGWMNIVIPYPAWAMKYSEIGPLPAAHDGPPAPAYTTVFALNLQED